MSFSVDPRSERYEDDDWTRRRGVKVAAAAVFAVVVGAVLVVSLALALRPEKSSVTASGSGSTTDSVQGIGPPPGSELGPYIDNRRSALGAAVGGERVAVVSLQRYTTEAKARQTTGSAQLLAMLAAMPGGGPSVVSNDLTSWLDEQQEATRNERDEIQKLIPTSGNDPEFKVFYEQEVQRLNQILETVKPDSELVFAVVVRAPVTHLREMAENPDVRMVDVGPSPSADPKSDYRGVRPEETVRANDPATRPV